MSFALLPIHGGLRGGGFMPFFGVLYVFLRRLLVFEMEHFGQTFPLSAACIWMAVATGFAVEESHMSCSLARTTAKWKTFLCSDIKRGNKGRGRGGLSRNKPLSPSSNIPSELYIHFAIPASELMQLLLVTLLGGRERERGHLAWIEM